MIGDRLRYGLSGREIVEQAREREERAFAEWRAWFPQMTGAGGTWSDTKHSRYTQYECELMLFDILVTAWWPVVIAESERKRAERRKQQRALGWQRHKERMLRTPEEERITAAEWKEIKRAYGYRCVYCGIMPERLSQDHVKPLARRGKHTARNVVPACMHCNREKSDGAALPFVVPLLEMHRHLRWPATAQRSQKVIMAEHP